MPHKLFLSHDSRDRERAKAIAQAVQRLTLGQISVWHSSDDGPSGGLRPGQVWLDEIRRQIADSRALVVLLTPQSVNRPWLLFEAGFGAAQINCAVIPVCVGIDSVADVPFPLAMYQTFQLADYDSLKRFAEKLLAMHQIPFDEGMARPVLEEAVAALTREKSDDAIVSTSPPNPSLAQAMDTLREYLDRRFAQVMNATADNGALPSASNARYNVAIDLNMKSEAPRVKHIEIGPDTTVQDVLDNIYFMLDGEVGARKYLEQWILRDLGTKEHLVIREMQYRVPAMSVFHAGSKWAVIKLAKPYSPIGRLDYFLAKPPKADS
ncbi:MAG: toll/interleukin-1 receptor domain-containing protein [Proteobacteria bacterium]|nr:toll/interleukin-1 receptor domain-containing protein [Pseudomonadota bacterium]